MVLFTIVFIISWTGAVIDRILGILGQDPPIQIVWWHDIGVASLGLTDALVWGTSSLWKHDLFEKHLKNEKENDCTQDIDINNNYNNNCGDDMEPSVDETASEFQCNPNLSLIVDQNSQTTYKSFNDRDVTPQA